MHVWLYTIVTMTITITDILFVYINYREENIFKDSLLSNVWCTTCITRAFN